MKHHVYIMITVFVVLAFWGLIVYDYVVRRHFMWTVHGIFIGVVCPLFLFSFGRAMIKFGQALVYQHNDELPLLASQLSIRYLGAFPLLLLLASDAVAQILSVTTLYNNMCALMPGTKPPGPNEQFYHNCTRSYFAMMGPDEPINLMYINTDTVTDNTTVVELYTKIELKAAIEDYIPVPLQSIFKMFQAGEVILVMSSSIILSRICRLSYRDLFAGRSSIWEMVFLITTGVCLFCEYVLSGLEMAPNFSSPHNYFSFMIIATAPFFPVMLVRILCALKLISDGLKVIQMEKELDSNLRADLSKVEREAAYSKIKKKYSYGAFIIHQRSLETIAHGGGVDLLDTPDTKKEEFRKYLEKSGVIDALTKVLVGLYEEPERPPNAVEYIKRYLGAPAGVDVEALKSENARLKKENAALQEKIEQAANNPGKED
eukprot:g4735.t1